MNIDSLTYGELKQIAAMFANQAPAPARESIAHPLIGQYVIARCYAAGVHAGTVERVDGENVILSESTRLWSWKAQDGIALSGVAQNGINRANSKLDTLNPRIYLTGVCELIPCTEKAKGTIRG